MASIKGVSLKSIVNITGREGYGFTAKVFLNGKNVGTVEDYATGSPLNFHADCPDTTEKVNQIASEYYKNYCVVSKETEFLYKNNEMFFNDLAGLCEAQKKFHKEQKKNNVIYSIREISDPNSLSYFICSNSSANNVNFKERMLNERKAVKIIVYNSDTDFDLK